MEEKTIHTPGECKKHIVRVETALAVLNGKWKLPIILSLQFGNKRFSQIAKEIPNITDKMLSKELRDLECHELVERKVYDSRPVVIEYRLTEYGFTLKPVIEMLRNWGATHEARMLTKEKGLQHTDLA